MQFAIIGLGAFGKTVALQLEELGNHVTGIDTDEKAVDAVSNLISRAIIADATDPDVLEEVNIEQYEGVLVSIGEDLEASLLCVLNLLKLNIKNIWVKAKSDAHHAILKRLGIEHIVRPEHDMGIRTSQALNYPLVLQYMQIGDNHLIIKMLVTTKWAGISLADFNHQYPDIQVLAVRRDEKVFTQPDAWLTMNKDDRLVLMGQAQQLKQLASEHGEDNA